MNLFFSILGLSSGSSVGYLGSLRKASSGSAGLLFDILNCIAPYIISFL